MGEMTENDMHKALDAILEACTNGLYATLALEVDSDEDKKIKKKSVAGLMALYLRIVLIYLENAPFNRAVLLELFTMLDACHEEFKKLVAKNAEPPTANVH
jgi:hypothetical protein